MAVAVVTVATGGLPVVDVTATTPRLGLPVTEVANGIPVTKVTLPRGGLPVTFVSDGSAPANISGTLATTVAPDSVSISGTVVEAFSGPGDAVPGMVAAWGTHAFDAAAVGVNSQTVVRASDSGVQSFAPLTDGANNKAGITTFLTATTGKTSVLFDQVGALDATQTTAGNRPAVTLSGPHSILTTTFTKASSHFLTCGNSSTLNPTAGISISAWVSHTGTGTGEYYAVARDDNTLGRSYAFGRTGDTWQLQMNGGVAVSFTKTISAGTLQHIAVTGDSSTGYRLYIDGLLVATGAWFVPNATTGITTIGKRTYAGFESYWDGTIDDVIFDNRAWSAPEVFSLYTKGKVYFDPAFVPTHPAAAVGYNTLVLFDDFNNTSTIDMANTNAPGFNWYLTRWFTGGATTISSSNISVSGSVLTIGGGGGDVWPHIATAFDTGLDTFTGTVYEDGGYFEMRMKFNPALYDVNFSANGIPNFYGMSIEHVADLHSTSGGKWPGQVSGYSHFIEVDFFETNSAATTNYFSVTHDWGGTAPEPGSGNYPQNIVTTNYVIDIGEMDFTKFHIYGCLWVPQVGATPGRLQRYFDGALVQSIYFLGPPGSPPLPVDSPNSFTPDISAEGTRTYSVIDTQRLVLLLGGGKNWPMQVDWVKVWK